MKTQKEIEAIINEAKRQLNVCQALKKAGCNQDEIKAYEMPCVASGYSMGEIVRLYVTRRGQEPELVDEADDRREYSGSAKKWTPRHGEINITLTARELRQLCRLQAVYFYASYRAKSAMSDEAHTEATKALINASDEYAEFIRSHSTGEIKRGGFYVRAPKGSR